MRVLTLAVVLGLAAAPAWADGPIATASGAQADAPQPTAAPPSLPSGGGAPAAQPVAMGPCGPEKVKPNGQVETSPHGEVEAGVGTHGYRYLGGSICQPIGQTGAVSVSVGQSQGGGWRR